VAFVSDSTDFYLFQTFIFDTKILNPREPIVQGEDKEP
jgi:hypothetical protein